MESQTDSLAESWRIGSLLTCSGNIPVLKESTELLNPKPGEGIRRDNNRGGHEKILATGEKGKLMGLTKTGSLNN